MPSEVPILLAEVSDVSCGKVKFIWCPNHHGNGVIRPVDWNPRDKNADHWRCDVCQVIVSKVAPRDWYPSSDVQLEFDHDNLI